VSGNTSFRILILTQYFPPEVGAAQVRLYSVAQELKRRGHDVRVVTAMPNYPTGRIAPEYRRRWLVREELNGLPVVRTWIYPATGRNPIKRLASYWSFTLSAMRGCWAAGRPDYVMVESPPLFLGLTGYLYARLRRSQLIFNVSDLWPESARELGIITSRPLLAMAQRLARFLYRHSDWVSAVTAGIAEAVAATDPRARIVSLPNSVDVDLFKAVPEPGPVEWIRPGEIAFVYAGTHGYVSGLDVIIDAAARLAGRKDIVFLFVGDGADKPRLKELASARGLQNVRFVPPQPLQAMPALFSACCASIVPLRQAEFFRRTLPAKILPSLACETPVIHCGDGDAARLIEEARCGLVVPPERGDLLADAVLQLAADGAQARQLGANGRRLVEERFGWSRAVDAWLARIAGDGRTTATPATRSVPGD
jgi:colanic acid biosynthesis glycosyl transferase WcaI